MGVPPGWRGPPGTPALERVERPGLVSSPACPAGPGRHHSITCPPDPPQVRLDMSILKVVRLLNLLSCTKRHSKRRERRGQEEVTGLRLSPPTVRDFILKSSFWLLTAILNPPQSPEKQLSAHGRVYAPLRRPLGGAGGSYLVQDTGEKPAHSTNNGAGKEAHLEPEWTMERPSHCLNSLKLAQSWGHLMHRRAR